MEKKESKRKIHDRYAIPKHLIFTHVFIFVTGMLILFLRLISLKVFWTIYILYFIFILLVFFFKITNKRKWLKENFREGSLDVVLITFLIIFFMLMSYQQKIYADNIDLNLDFKIYEFEIDFYPRNEKNNNNNFVLNGLNYYYDFDNQEGRIYFEIHKLKDSIKKKYVRIDFPANVSINKEDIQLSNRSNIYVSEIDYVPDIRNDMLFIEMVNSSFQDVEINISFKSNLKPNGRFRFYTFVKQAFASKRNTITFDMGDYYCQENCYGYMSSAETEWEGRKLVVKYPDDYNQNVGEEGKIMQQQVTLNTYYKPSRDLKESLNNLYISLFVSAIIMFGDLLRRTVKLFLLR